MGDEERDVRADFLYARPSFWSGVGRALDLWGTFDEYNVSRTTEEADMRALYSDWRTVGQTLRDSWFSVHRNRSGHARIERTDGRSVCSSCGKATGGYSVHRKTAGDPLKQAHDRK